MSHSNIKLDESSCISFLMAKETPWNFRSFGLNYDTDDNVVDGKQALRKLDVFIFSFLSIRSRHILDFGRAKLISLIRLLNQITPCREEVHLIYQCQTSHQIKRHVYNRNPPKTNLLTKAHPD